MRKVLLVVSLFIFFASFITPIDAEEEELNLLNFKVDHVAGKIEKLKEKVTLLIRFNKTSKSEHLQYLAEKRLAELVYVVETDQIDLVEPTASRYSTYIGNLTNYVTEKSVSSEKEDLLAMFKRHETILSELQKNFEFESGWWIAIQHDINSIAIFKEKISFLE